MRGVVPPAAQRTRPVVGSESPAMMRRSVLLPQPEGPRRLTKDCRATVRSTPASASVPLRKRREIFSRVKSGAASAREPANDTSGLFCRAHADAAIDEAQRVGLVIIHVLGIKALGRHDAVEILPARVVHGADAVALCVAAVDDPVLVH